MIEFPFDINEQNQTYDFTVENPAYDFSVEQSINVQTTSDYPDLNDKPQINSVELLGNKSSSDLGLADAEHTHVKADITDFAHTHTKSDITDFSHSHSKTDITDFAHTHTTEDITDFPTIPQQTLYIINVSYDSDEDEYYLTDTTFADICDEYDSGKALILIYTDEDGYAHEYTLYDYAPDDGYISFVATISPVIIKVFAIDEDDAVTYDESKATTSDLTNNSMFVKGMTSIWSGTSTTGASTSEKKVTISGFLASDQTVGVMVFITFSNTNTAVVSGLKLNVSNRGAKPIKRLFNGALADLDDPSSLSGTMPFIYDGTNWVTWYDTPDTKVYQQYQASSGYSYWRPLLIGKSSSGTEGFNPSSTTDQAYVFNTLEVQPSTGLIRMGGASFYSGSYTTKMTPTSLTANRTITIPNESGTMAMLEDVPTKVSDLNNDSGFLTLADLPIYNGGVS